jgi:signal transduction histidine kinase
LIRRHLSSSRSHFVVGLLLLTLVLTGVLAFEAYRSSRSHRVTAASALADNAAFAAWRFASISESKIDWLIAEPAFHYLQTTYGKEDWAIVQNGNPDAPELEECPIAIRYAFIMNPAGTKLKILEGVRPTVDTKKWLKGALREALTSYDHEWYHAVITGATDDIDHIVFYKVEFDDDQVPEAILGFEVDPAVLPEAFDHAFGWGTILPPALTGDLKNAEMLSVRVIGPAGQILYKSAREHGWEFAATDHFSPRYGDGLEVEVAIRPSMAETLIIGGLPKSRLPLIMGLLVLAGGMVAAAIFVLRRELEFSRLRTQFVSNVSHELRTPLAQIRMFVETLLLGRVRSKEEAQRSLEIMNREVRRLSNLVENILAFSRAERNGMQLKFEPTELTPLFKEVVDTFEPLASGRSVKLRTEVEADATATVDRSAVRQILLNLLDNAVKYGPSGQTVTLGLEVQNGTVQLRVDDEGPGVPPESREGVWEAFFRLDREREEATAGTGIGLSVVRELVLGHDGRAWVEEGPAGGARFLIELPVGQPDGGNGPEVAQ